MPRGHPSLRSLWVFRLKGDMAVSRGDLGMCYLPKPTILSLICTLCLETKTLARKYYVIAYVNT
jgi:hypothetical protein